MGLISGLIYPRADTPYKDGDDFWYGPIGARTASGAVVGADTGLKVSAVFQAVRLISETLAKVPLITYRRVDENGRERARDTQIHRLLHDKPNNSLTSYNYRLLAQAQVLLRGNHYAQIVPDRDGPVGQLIPLNPDRVTPKRLPGHRIGYNFRDDKNVLHPLTQDEVFHVRGPLLGDDLAGVTPLTYARECTGAALTMQSYADSLFRQGALHRGHYSVPGMLTPQQREQIHEVIRKETAGPSGWHNTLVLEAGSSFHPMNMTAADAEFILQLKYNVIEFARWFNLQPHLLRDLDKSSYSNHEQETLEFRDSTMLPHYVNWEQQITADLIADEDIFAEFLLDAIARADIKTRYEAYGMGIDRGFMTPNEARARDNIGNPLPGGDNARMQINTAMIGPDGRPIANPAGLRPPPGEQGNGQQARQHYYDRVLSATAARMVEIEAQGLRSAFKHGDRQKRLDEGAKFYERHAKNLSRYLCVDLNQAEMFAAERQRQFYDAIECGGHEDMIADLEAKGAERLLSFVMTDYKAEEVAERRAA